MYKLTNSKYDRGRGGLWVFRFVVLTRSYIIGAWPHEHACACVLCLVLGELSLAGKKQCKLIVGGPKYYTVCMMADGYAGGSAAMQTIIVLI